MGPSLLLALWPVPRPTTAVPTVATDTADTTARGLLMPSLLPPLRHSPRLPPTTAVLMADTGMADTTERGPQKPSPTTAMAAMVDTDMAMARGPLTPRLTTAVPMATDMADTTERGQLMPRLTTAMAAMVDTDTLTASKMFAFRDFKHPPSQCSTLISKSRHPSQKFYKIRAKIFIPKCQEELM